MRFGVSVVWGGGGGGGGNEKLIIGGNPVAAELGSNEIVEHAHYWIRF